MKNKELGLNCGVVDLSNIRKMSFSFWSKIETIRARNCIMGNSKFDAFFYCSFIVSGETACKISHTTIFRVFLCLERRQFVPTGFKGNSNNYNLGITEWVDYMSGWIFTRTHQCGNLIKNRIEILEKCVINDNWVLKLAVKFRSAHWFCSQ